MNRGANRQVHTPSGRRALEGRGKGWKQLQGWQAIPRWPTQVADPIGGEIAQDWEARPARRRVAQHGSSGWGEGARIAERADRRGLRSAKAPG